MSKQEMIKKLKALIEQRVLSLQDEGQEVEYIVPYGDGAYAVLVNILDMDEA